MKVTLMGTGAADGWPNAFCHCVSCDDARRLRDFRAQTAALVDDVLMLDFGPDAPGAAVRHGCSLAGGATCPGHSCTCRSPCAAIIVVPVMGRALRRSGVIGPADALDSCRAWVGPGDPVRFTPVVAGDQVRVGGV